MPSGIAPHMLELEITESAAMQNMDLTMKVLRELKEMGVAIAIDDFGTGQSSLIYLKQFPIETVKIDKEFLRDVTSDETAAAIVSYIINLAHTLRLKVVAEGVEDEEQYTFLRHYNCDLMQGYIFSRPIPGAQVFEFLQQAVFQPRTLEVGRPTLWGETWPVGGSHPRGSNVPIFVTLSREDGEGPLFTMSEATSVTERRLPRPMT